MNNDLTDWHWERQPAAAALLADWLDEAIGRNAWLRGFGERLHAESGNRLGDLVEMWIRPDDAATRDDLDRVGYEAQDVPADGALFHHPGGMFPRVLLTDREAVEVGLKVESVADFAAANGLTPGFHGRPGELLRYAAAAKENGVSVYAIERRGTLVADCDRLDSPSLVDQAEVLERFRARERNSADEAAGFNTLSTLVEDAVSRVGRDVACALFFAAERDFWCRRNAAARWQLARQERLGIGWANHDHHTYRSSRRHFHRLVALFELLGFHCRERFYPGPEAGWARR